MQNVKISRQGWLPIMFSGFYSKNNEKCVKSFDKIGTWLGLGFGKISQAINNAKDRLKEDKSNQGSIAIAGQEFNHLNFVDDKDCGNNGTQTNGISKWQG